ncbi:unnamed protein product [Brassica rapa subsp. narinosa]
MLYASYFIRATLETSHPVATRLNQVTIWSLVIQTQLKRLTHRLKLSRQVKKVYLASL